MIFVGLALDMDAAAWAEDHGLEESEAADDFAQLVRLAIQDGSFVILIKQWAALQTATVTAAEACPITTAVNCRSRDCELHYMAAPLRLAPTAAPRGPNHDGCFDD